MSSSFNSIPPLATAKGLCAHSLRFPYLSAVGALLLKGTKRNFLRFDLHSISRERLLLKCGSLPKLERHWFITSDGLFWRLNRYGTRRSFWRWLAPVIDFTLAECQLEPGRHLITDELLDIVGPLKSPSGFPAAGQLKSFLRKHPQQMFDAALFKEFWGKHGYELEPPDKWGDVLELGRS